MNKLISVFAGLFLLLSICVQGEEELVGPLSKEDLLQNLPEWEELVASYIPKPEIIEKLKLIDQKIKVEVFLGTWCPDCKQHVSAYCKIMEMADNPLISTSYTGIPRDREARQEFIQGKNIVKVPTFIIYFQDQEKGRIIEIPTKSLEEDLLDIIKGIK